MKITIEIPNRYQAAIWLKAFNDTIETRYVADVAAGLLQIVSAKIADADDVLESFNAFEDGEYERIGKQTGSLIKE